MANALAIGPAVMINRLVDRSGAPQAAAMAKVAELRMALQLAVQQETERSAHIAPDGEGEAPIIDSGAAVDRLI